MRTMTVEALKQQIDLCLWRLRYFMNTGKWTYRIKARSLAQAEQLVATSRKQAQRRIRRLDAQCPSVRQSLTGQWIASVLSAESWRFALWLRDHSDYAAKDWQQQQEDIELILISNLGKEIKRLGFELDA